MAATVNTDPIYSRAGDCEWQAVLKTAAADYTGASSLNEEVFEADDDNGGFLQRLRFKALGNNVATVARIYINNGLTNQSVITAPGTPAGTPSAGVVDAFMANGTTTNFAVIVPIGQGGDVGTASAENGTGVTTVGPNAAIMWAWNAPANAHNVSAYRVHVGLAAAAEAEYFVAPYSNITASQANTTMTVTAINTCPDKRICLALTVGTVFATGIAADTYITQQLTSSEADGSFGRTGTYKLSATATVGSTTCTTNPLKYMQLIPGHQMTINIAGTHQQVSWDGQVTVNNSWFYGEVSLPATTAIATAATPDVDYWMNLALPPGYEVYAGLGTTVSAGWQIGSVGGKY